MTDYFALDDQHALHLARRVVSNLNYIKTPSVSHQSMSPDGATEIILTTYFLERLLTFSLYRIKIMYHGYVLCLFILTTHVTRLNCGNIGS